MVTTIQIVRYYICTIAIIIGAVFVGSTITHQPMTWRGFFISCACFLIMPVAFQLVGGFVAPQYPITVLAVALTMFFAYQQRGIALIIRTLICMAIMMIADAITGLSFLAVLGTEKTNDIASEQTPLVYLMHGICVGIIMLLAVLYEKLRIKASHVDWKNTGRILRLIILPVATIFGWVSIASKTSIDNRSEYFIEILPITLSSFIALIISITYIVQDVRYVHQKRQNSALLEQKKIQDAMLQDTRIFRHNIANILYGFQGTMMTGNTDSIRQYYEQMASTCRIINNENVLALQRIPSIPVHSLLMEKIKSANEQKIPFYVYTDENLIWRGFRDSEMCEVLGVLVDNALEATKDSAAPLVTLELHNAENDMEVVVRNTCRNIEHVFEPSSKPGHEGLGLTSLRGILARHTNALFNLFTQGRFVEAHLLMR